MLIDYYTINFVIMVFGFPIYSSLLFPYIMSPIFIGLTLLVLPHLQRSINQLLLKHHSGMFIANGHNYKYWRRIKDLFYACWGFTFIPKGSLFSTSLPMNTSEAVELS